MMLMDVPCLSVVTDVSAGNGVETLTSRLMAGFWFTSMLKLWKGSCDIFIDDLIHKLFSSSIWVSFDDGTSSWRDSRLSFIHVSSP